MNFLCICTYYKGFEFLRACKAAGNTVYLLTNQKLKDKPWPREAIDEFFYLEDSENNFGNLANLLKGLSFTLRSRKVDVVVSLDDFDVEKGALVREHFRIAGMGQTTARYFRDKLAMRMRAVAAGINVPPFSALFNDVEITEYLHRTAAPWLIKPRSEASAAGIRKVHSFQEAWDTIHSLGDERDNFLIEQFKPGDVFHVDALTVNSKVVFARSSKYLNTPFEVAHGGGIFRSVTVKFGSKEEKALAKMNEQVLSAFGLQYGASHTEVIKSHDDGSYYFLETASRVGGANIAEMVEFSSGINLWREWANLETAVAKGKTYKLPKVSEEYAGVIISLTSMQHPDYQPFNDPEIVWKMKEDQHIGMIIKSAKQERVMELMEKYALMIRDLGYHASAPSTGKAIH